mmetsp:Transcript_2039/g.5333  ORF Transcript_2039/g.5333 Transcript_2039/m.5333 type:complete len:513 (+) Transcript_2039:19-1557(+)
MTAEGAPTQANLFSTNSPKVIAGCILTLFVVFLWVGSSVLSQYIFDNADFGKPMFMTIFNSGLFAMYLFGFCFFENWRTDGFNKVELDEDYDDDGLVDGAANESYPLLAPDASEGNESTTRRQASKGKRTKARSPSPSHGNGIKKQSRPTTSNGADTESEPKEASEADPLDDAILAVAEADAEIEKPSRRQAPPPPARLPWTQVAALAAWYTGPWILGSYTYNLSLCFSCGCGTSVSVHTVISGTSALFALIMGYVLLDSSTATYTNFIAAAVSTAGAALITGVDFTPGAGNTWQGDLLCGMSAVCHGWSSVLLKKWIPRDDAVCMEMFFGFLGLWSILAGIPLMFLLDHIGFETFHMLSGGTFVCLVVNAVLGTVVSNVLWAKAVMLTSPLLVNLGTTLTVPLAFAADAISPYATHFKFQWQYAVGAAMVLGAFLCVNVAEEQAIQEAMSRDGSETTASDDDRRSRSTSLCSNRIIEGPWTRPVVSIGGGGGLGVFLRSGKSFTEDHDFQI